MSCTGWNPGSEISYYTPSQTYLVNGAFIAGLFADPEALYGCDNATVLWGTNGFEVADANSGELLYELGLRNGDLIKTINGIDLESYADVADIVMLWTNGEVEFTVEIERSSTPMEFDYYAYFT